MFSLPAAASSGSPSSFVRRATSSTSKTRAAKSTEDVKEIEALRVVQKDQDRPVCPKDTQLLQEVPVCLLRERECRTGVFVLNGFDDLESFREISESDLDFLKVTDVTQREKLFAAAEGLADDTTSSVSGNIEISYFSGFILL